MYKRISIEDAKTKIDQENAICVDIRDPASFQQGRIPGALALNNDNVKAFIDNNDKSTALLVCCYHGNSSQSAAQFLAEQGFSDVYSIDGGYEAWKLVYDSES